MWKRRCIFTERITETDAGTHLVSSDKRCFGSITDHSTIPEHLWTTVPFQRVPSQNIPGTQAARFIK